MAKLNSLEDLKNLFPEAVGTYEAPKEEHVQHLEAHFSNKGRGGKTVTVIKGFEGTTEEIKELAKYLKTQCSVGGSIKDFEIIIQGNMRDKIIQLLEKKGHIVKRVGG